jgi:hypothetical protein
MILQNTVFSQEERITAFELSVDQDNFVDFLHDDPEEAYNYTVGLRLGIYGELANHVYLGLPFVRQIVDEFLIDRLVDNTMLRRQKESHNFVLTINGFSPTFISDETQIFMDTMAAGYSLENDLPFSSFTGFRSTRRLELSKAIAHIAGQLDVAVNSSFTIGFASLSLASGVENLFGGNRPDAVLWKRDDNKPYPTGQLNHAMVPLFMYSLSVETVVWRPVRKVLLQVRPEFNLGYYTDIGIGLDFGKVMNSNRFIDNLSYTDTNNPGMVSVNTEDISFSLVAGGAVRTVLYNAHYHGFFGWNKREEWAWADTERFLLEGYVGLKLQFYKKVELNFSINTRSPALNIPDTKYNTWGTFGLKYLLGEQGEGCYD